MPSTLEWNSKVKEAFELLKGALSDYIVLNFPVLTTNASSLPPTKGRYQGIVVYTVDITEDERR